MAVLARELAVLDTASIDAEQAGSRLDTCLAVLFPGRYTSASEVQVNGSVATIDTLMQQGDTVQIVSKVGGGQKPTGAEGKPGLEVAYEDDHMACIIKPQVHRLDAGTGGLLLVAKTRVAGAALARDLAQHNMQKRYLALVLGHLEGAGIINFPLQDKPAVTLFSVVEHCPSETYGWLTIVNLWPKTGRTHQLRKHMAYIGHPILGEPHGNTEQPDWNGQGQGVEEHSSSQAQVQQDDPAGVEDSGAASREGDVGSDSDEEASARSSGQAGAHVLKDGSSPLMCLWAVQLNLLHPVTRIAMELKIDHPISVYRGILDIEAPGSKGTAIVIVQQAGLGPTAVRSKRDHAQTMLAPIKGQAHSLQATSQRTIGTAIGMTLDGVCDDDKGLCYCDGPIFGRIPAAPGSPPGTPPLRVGRPLPEYCQPSASLQGAPMWGTVPIRELYGSQWGWCNAPVGQPTAPATARGMVLLETGVSRSRSSFVPTNARGTADVTWASATVMKAGLVMTVLAER
eukprot:gene12386-12520_t